MDTPENKEANKTKLYDNHKNLGAKIIDFSNWLMPLNYSKGIIQEHLDTRKNNGLFDISHMATFKITGGGSIPFLQYALTNNAASLKAGESQYSIISDSNGSAIDDVYLYCYEKDDFLLIANSSNRSGDFIYLKDVEGLFNNVEITDISEETSMLSLQGPDSGDILISLMPSGDFPLLEKNRFARVNILGADAFLARTGYTGELTGYEIITKNDNIFKLWDALIEKGANPSGLGARDSLRLESMLPLYGHELGKDPDGNDIPIFSSPSSRIAVSFSEDKGEFVGKKNLEKQYRALGKIMKKDYSDSKDLPVVIIALELMDKGIARHNDRVFLENDMIGYVTSGTIVPYWDMEIVDGKTKLKETFNLRSIALALIKSDKCYSNIVEVKIRENKKKAFVMPYFLKKMSPYLYPVTHKSFL